MIVVRYADDVSWASSTARRPSASCGRLQERLAKFGLALHPDKTRLIEFGRYAAERRARRGEGKPETFDFLGFTHCCGHDATVGPYTVRRLTVKKRMRATLQRCGSNSTAGGTSPLA